MPYLSFLCEKNAICMGFAWGQPNKFSGVLSGYEDIPTKDTKDTKDSLTTTENILTVIEDDLTTTEDTPNLSQNSLQSLSSLPGYNNLREPE